MDRWIDRNALAEAMFFGPSDAWQLHFLPQFVNVTAESKVAKQGDAREFKAISIDVPEDGVPVFNCNEADLHPEHLRIRGDRSPRSQRSHLSASILATIQRRAVYLVTLHLHRFKLEGAQFEALCQGVASSPTLQALTLLRIRVKDDDGGGLGPEGAGILAEALGHQACQLESLHIYHCGICTEGVEKLSRALIGCKIWHLMIYERGVSFDSIGDALLSPSCNLDVLTLDGYAHSQKFFDALSDPSCQGLRYLEFGRMHETRVRRGTQVQWLKVNACDAQFDPGSLTRVVHLNIRQCPMSLGEELRAPECRLESLLSHCDDSTEILILEALETNYRSRLKVLKFRGIDEPLPQHLEQRRVHILNRNALFLASENQGVIEPSIAKLFICGDGEVGKTTIARNLRRSFQVPACFQRHAATQGMNLRMLSYNKGRKLMVCDIAGQAEYHAFHHYFMRGSDKDMFLIVCKVTTTEDMSKRLSYWLRFIASHRSSNPNRKPKVIIALNHFEAGVRRRSSDQVARTIDKFDGFLDIRLSGDERYFHVVATKVKSLQLLRTALGKALEQVLHELPPIPPLCEKLETRKASYQMSCALRWKLPAQRVVHIHELLETIERVEMPGEPNEDTKMRRVAALKFALTCMHDMGKAVYFGAEDVLSSTTILDVQWFVQELVGKFIRVNRGNQNFPQRAMSMEDFERIVTSMCPVEHLKFVLGALQELGVVLCQGNDVIVPAMLQDEFPGWSPGEHGHEYWHWGRRLECKDKICTLLPSGIFTMIQVQAKTLCTNPSDMGNATSNHSFKVGKGWVYFERSDVRVVVRIGGVTGHWEDRYWVDIMVKGQKERGHQAAKMMKSVKELVVGICSDLPKLELEELIINPAVVQRRMWEAGEGSQGGDSSDTGVAVPLCGIKGWFKKVLAEQCDEEYHTWRGNERSLGQELLTVDELEGLASEWKAQVSAAYEECIADQIPESSCCISTSSRDPFEELYQRLVKEFGKRFNNIDASLEALHQIVTQTQEFMKNYGEQILSACSSTLNKLETRYPRYPYFCEGNKLFKYSSVVGTKVKLRYLCESSKPHQVPGYEGLSLELPHEWFTKYSHVLVPALKTFFLLAKIGGKVAASALRHGDVFDAPIEWAEQGLDKVLDSVLSTELARNRKPPSEVELMDLFGKVGDQAIKSQMELKSFVRKTFGLREKTVENRCAWVCEKCF